MIDKKMYVPIVLGVQEFIPLFGNILRK